MGAYDPGWPPSSPRQLGPASWRDFCGLIGNTELSANMAASPGSSARQSTSLQGPGVKKSLPDGHNLVPLDPTCLSFL